MSFAGCVDDVSFGPVVRGCRDDFDFTLKFEKILLDLIPASVFIAATLPRLLYLLRRPVVIKGSIFSSVKLLAIGCYAALQLALLAMAATKSTRLRDLSIASASVQLLSSACMLVLSCLEHARSLRPSILLSSYLFLTILCDTAQARTLWLASATGDELAVARLATAAVALKAAILLLESRHKNRWASLDLERHSPEETTGIAGLGAYLWLSRLFLAGYRKVLRMDDLYVLDSSMASQALGDRLASAAAGSEFRGRRSALARALARILALPLLTPVGPRIALVGFGFCQPFLISSTLSFLEKPEGERDPNVGYGLIGGTILIYGGKTLSEALYWYFHERCLWMIRGTLASAIYKKTTEVKINAVDDTAAITLMSTDVENVRRGMLMFHESWANLIEVSIAGFLLYRTLGTAFVAPIVLVVACGVAAACVAAFTGQRQRNWMDKIQARVGNTANVIANMKSLSISGLALPIQEIVQGLRLEEIRVGRRYRMVQAWSLAIGYAPFFIAPVITFAWTSKTLSPRIMFTSYSYLQLLCTPLTNLFSSFPMILSGAACLGRIQKFLGSESRHDYRQPPSRGYSSEKEVHLTKPPASSVHTEKAPFLAISKGSFGWTKEAMNLSNIDVAIPAGLTIVVGTIASGKSTFCNALLGEAPVFEGKTTLGPQSRRIGYCSQHPFLSNATVRQNILGLSSLDQGRYDEVIEATMLGIDLLTLPQGDDTKVGSNGITLSGGQKQRVSLARALYLDTDCYILDDVLNGLDADTEELVYRRVFGPHGLIKKRKATAVLCTHSVRHMTSADHIIALGPDGTVIEQGTFKDLVANEKYVHSLGVKVRKEDIRSSSQSSSTRKALDDEIVADPPMRTEKATASQPPVPPRDAQEDWARMNGDWKIYKHYYRSVGVWLSLAVIITSTATGFFYNFQAIWINFWSAGITAQPPKQSTAYYLSLFAVMQVLGLLMLFLFVWIGFCFMIAQSGAVLHQQALHTVLHAPLRFFTTTDNGVVTNLFSQDMTLVDTELPMALLSMMLDLAICTGMAAVVAVSSPYMVISYPFLMAIMYVIQKFYLRTSRQLRLLDLEAKSPLYTHFIDTIKGLATFRAFGWIPASVAANNAFVDTSQRPAYLLAMIQRWLAFALDVVVAILAVVVVTLSTQLRTGAGTGFTGASMVTLMTFGPALTGLIRCYTSLETSLGAVSRLKAFSETVKPESGDGEDVVPDEQWPARGQIEIQGVSATYSDISSPPGGNVDKPDICSPAAALALALRDITISIPAGQKVAICGRTGSGKSSLILLLLRLLDPCSGRVTIDDVPLDGVDRPALRQRLVAIPQDAVFLPEGCSYRANLDPLGVATEDECLAALQAVDLLGVVEGRGGLEAGMGPDTLSGGQRQLFSLARAVIRRRTKVQNARRDGGLLLLDEVSSSVDIDTERAMHAVIQREFKGCTIVMVSHRLEMVMDFDVVVVMDKGEVVETGAPRALVEMEKSRFKELWEASGRIKEEGKP